ncbi:MaoC family dehydratase [Acidobacteria bacterium AH-259-A15]|nr:MaoC family dehydratase [Acidobacteria bacterium AH-259-A15]
MTTPAERALEIFQQQIGVKQPPGEWHCVDQEQIDRFAEATLDHNYIHIDPERAASSPFKTTIAHGFLTLSLLSYLVKTIPRSGSDPFQDLVLAINYGLDRVRFVRPVKVGSGIRARRVILGAELKDPHTIQIKQRITVETAGEEKPACVAVWLTRLTYHREEFRP